MTHDAQTAPSLVGAGRSVALRTRGRAQGPIVRLVSANDLGEMIKPFVFLDLVDTDQALGHPGPDGIRILRSLELAAPDRMKFRDS